MEWKQKQNGFVQKLWCAPRPQPPHPVCGAQHPVCRTFATSHCVESCYSDVGNGRGQCIVRKHNFQHLVNDYPTRDHRPDIEYKLFVPMIKKK